MSRFCNLWKLILAFFIMTPLLLSAQSSVWNQLGGGDWNEKDNWTPDTVPNLKNTAVEVGLDGNQTINLQGGTYTIGSLESTGTTGVTTFSNGTLDLEVTTGRPVFNITKQTAISASLSGSQGFKKEGAGVLNLQGVNTGLSGEVWVSGGTLGTTALDPDTTSFKLSTGTTLELLSTGTVTLSNIIAVDGTGDHTLKIAQKNTTYTIETDISLDNQNFSSSALHTTSTATWTGKLTGGADTKFALTTGNGVHILSFNDTSNFTGTFAVSGGAVSALIAKDDAFGNGSTLQIGGNRILSSSSDARTLHSQIKYSSSIINFGDATNYPDKTGKLTFIGGLNVGDNTNRSLSVDGETMVVEISGSVVHSIGGNGSISWTKSGSGTLILSDTTAGSTYNRQTIVSAGTLLVNGTISSSTSGTSFTVASNAVLGGTGRIDRALTMESGGILSPGDSTALDQTGTLTIGENVTFASGGIFQVQLFSDTAYDRLTLDGGLNRTLTIDGAELRLSLNPEFTFEKDMTFTIVNGFWDRVGTFAGLANTSVFTEAGTAFQINYFGNSIVLTVVPEPSSAVLLLGAGLTAVWFLGRRRRG